MSVSAVSSSNTYPVQNYQSPFQQIKNDFQQLGKDLQSGNLSQAQADYATLSKDLPSSQQSSTSQAAKDLNSVGQALQAGNLSQAQQAYANVQQDVQQAAGGHHHHHHHGGGESSKSSASGNSGTLSQDFTALGNDLKSNNLSAAQQAYTKIQADMQQYSSGSGTNVIGGSNNQQVLQPQPAVVNASA
jgi:soluble cytochrome b562